MAWDTTAKKVAVKAIGTVESSMQWDAINYADPITVGIAQWYGTRAAGVLNRIRATPAWSGVAWSLDYDLSTINGGDAFWNTRHLTTAEGSSVQPVLSSATGKSLQTEQFFTDLDGYQAPASAHGIDSNADTDAFIMYCVGYHQSPLYANQAVTPLPVHPTLVQVRDAFLSDPVLGQYPTRYNTAYSIIAAHDTAGVPDPPGTPTPAPDPIAGGGGGGTANTTLNMRQLVAVGDTLRAFLGDGQTLDFYPTGRGVWVPRGSSAQQPTPPPTPEPPPPAPTGWVHPLPTGVLTSPYGPRDPSIGGASMHWGSDFSTPGYAGEIHAPTDMVVTVSAVTGGYGGSAGTHVKGHSVDGAYSFCFYHMEYASNRPNVGETVPRGTVIGIEGATGNVTGRHLHFEVYEGNYANPWPPPDGPTPVDPVPVLIAHGVPV